jgi:chain length determinant protein EpsF
MNFTQFFLILKARALIVLLALSVTVATTVLVSMMLPKSYTATNTLVVDAKAKDPVTGALMPAQLMPGYMATQVDILKSQNVGLKVVQGLKLTENSQVRADFQTATAGQGSIQHWLTDMLLKKLEVTPSRESAVIQISFSASDPRFAAIIANAFAQAYINTNLELKVEPARQTSVWFESQIKGLRENLEQAQGKLSSYQRQKGLIASDERIDVETSRLAELSSQLVAAQSQTYDSTSRQNQSGNALAEIEHNPLIQGLKRDLAVGETKLAELGHKVGLNHPQYQRAQVEVEALRAELNSEMKVATLTVGTTAKVAQGRESDIRTALAAQKSRVLSLKQQRDEAALLIHEVENAQRVYDTALQRFNQSALESQNTQTDVVVLNPAVPPHEVSSPKIVLNTILSVFLGVLLGIGLALLMEMIDRRVRSSADLSGAMDIPVLGEISKFKTSRAWWSFRRQTA